MNQSKEVIAVIGLGYVGLPVAVALAQKAGRVIAFDTSHQRVAALKAGDDRTGEVTRADLTAAKLQLTVDPDDLREATFFIVTVPTPIDVENRPDLAPLKSACELIGPRLSKGAIVVFESTVYPGVTEEFCGPLLEQASALKRGTDFFLGYSPERINPGDREHRLASITKIIAAENPEALARTKAVYGSIITAGLHEAPSIKVAEAAKVIENTQRDLNIALMNELALIFDRMDIRTKDVLEAAGTKWNFIRFQPGLVGGHCIGVDPYYLTAAAERLGYRPEVILAGRNVNDSMGRYIANKMVKMLARTGCAISGARVGVLGLTFKEDVPDLRNSRVPDIIAELREYGVETLTHDPWVDAAEAVHEYGVEIVPSDSLRDLDGLIVAVGHRQFLEEGIELAGRLRPGGILIDVKSVLASDKLSKSVTYWSL